MQEVKQKKGISPILTAVGGAVVGVGLAIAGALALKDKKTNKKVMKIVDDVTAKSKDVTKKVVDSAQSTKKAVAKTLEKTQGEVKKIIRESK